MYKEQQTSSQVLKVGKTVSLTAHSFTDI